MNMNPANNSNRDWLVDIKDLHVTFSQDDETVHAVNGVDIRVHKGEAVGIVGESGCGKTVTSYSMLNILPSNGEIVSGEVKYREDSGKVIDITKLNPRSREMRRLRGGEIAMIFQEPMASSVPSTRLGTRSPKAFCCTSLPKTKESERRLSNTSAWWAFQIRTGR